MAKDEYLLMLADSVTGAYCGACVRDGGFSLMYGHFPTGLVLGSTHWHIEYQAVRRSSLGSEPAYSTCSYEKSTEWEHVSLLGKGCTRPWA